VNFALLTDLYQLTMAYGYWKQGIHQRTAVFHHFFRKQPFQKPSAVVAGLETLISFIETFSFSESDLAYLATIVGSDGNLLFDASFLDYLGSISLALDIDAVPEGRSVFPHEPIVRVQGPLLQAQLIESILLNIINFQTLIATKASHIVREAGSDPVIELGMRRAQGFDGALSAARAAYIGGVSATSNTLAGKQYDIPVRGTQSHSWIMTHEDEEQAFRSFADAFPGNCFLLLDTYNVDRALEIVIKIAKVQKVLGVRIDSGDIAQISRRIRKRLDQAGLKDIKIMASNDLDEHEILRLKEAGACIDIWGVGTRLVTGMGQSALDGVYKLSMIERPDGSMRPAMKVSEGKVSLPGRLGVRRYSNRDLIYHGELEADSGEDLLVPIYRAGILVYKTPSIHMIRSGREILAEKHEVGFVETLLEEKNKLMEKICPSFS